MTRVITHNPPPQVLINVVNPLVRFALRSPLHGVLDSALLTLHVTGRATGRRFDIPVGYVEKDGRLVVVTQHRWRGNLRAGGDVEVTFRGRRGWMHAQLDEEPALVAFLLRGVIEQIGWQAAGRRLGLKVAAGRTPTVAEVEEAVRQYDLATIALTPSGAPTHRRGTERQETRS